MKRNFNKSDNLEDPDNPVRTGVLKSAMVDEEEKLYGRRDKWTKQAEYDLKESEKKLRENKKQQKKELTTLEQHDEEQLARKYPYTKSRYNDAVFAIPDKKGPLPTVAHNYSFWADLILHQRAEKLECF